MVTQLLEEKVLIPIDLIDPNPYQPRQVEDPAAVAELADSIARNGMLQVPSARCVGDRYQLAFGHTRLAAHKLLQTEHMPLIIRDLDDLQMFEMGVAENIKRRDLNPIETAEAMRRYMKEFKKNSVETGEFFNVSPEKVRSTIRLLNLPEKLRAGVADGTITQSNARKLLTLQRVAPEEVVTVANKLKGNADPDEIIGRQLKDSSHSVEMWKSWQNGDPHAGSGLWPLRLSADRFPSKYLPELRAVDVAKSLDLEYSPQLRTQIEDYIDAIQRRPEFVSEFAEAHGNTDPEKVLLMERIAHLLNPPGCTACPLYVKLGGDHYCAFRLCHTRKSRAWEENEIQSASKKLGIAIYQTKVDGDSRYLSSYDDSDKKLFEKRHSDLRIKKGTNWSQHFDGVPSGYSIVVIGEAMKKRQKAREETNDQSRHEAYLAEQRRLAKIRDANREATYTFLWNVATPVFQTVMGEVTNVEFLRQFADRVVRGVPAEEPDKKASKAVKIDFYRRSLLFSLLDGVLEMWDICQKKKPVTAMAKDLQGLATTWGVKLPKNWMEQAAEADKGITVTTETAN